MILTYHEIAPDSSRYVYSIERRNLEEHLRMSLSVDHRLELTLDDGHGSQYRHGLPLLRQYGLRATFFITVGWTNVRREYMDWSQLSELVAAGHQVQSHGWSHRLFTACPDAELEVELRRSRTVLEDRLGIAVRSVSLPGGRGDARVWRACAAAGYKRIYTSDPWAKPVSRNGIAREGRFMVRAGMNWRQIERVLAAEDRVWDPLRVRDAAKAVGRRVLGDRLYLRLWRYFGASTNRQAIDEECIDGAM